MQRRLVIFLCALLGLVSLACEHKDENSGNTSCWLKEGDNGATILHCADGQSISIAPAGGSTDAKSADVRDGRDGQDGAVGMSGPSCTVVDNGDGTATLQCPEGAAVVLDTNGGEDGSSCGVEDNGDGTATISCTDGSSVTFHIYSCGNGKIEPGEECDDRGESSSCTNFCTHSSCGDGIINSSAGEECDESGETETCDDDCTLPSCGDGKLNSMLGEKCDGNFTEDDPYYCSSDCQKAYVKPVIQNPTTWDYTALPLHLPSTVHVEEGSTLEIAPGVSVVGELTPYGPRPYFRVAGHLRVGNYATEELVTEGLLTFPAAREVTTPVVFQDVTFLDHEELTFSDRGSLKAWGATFENCIFSWQHNNPAETPSVVVGASEFVGCEAIDFVDVPFSAFLSNSFIDSGPLSVTGSSTECRVENNLFTRTSSFAGDGAECFGIQYASDVPPDYPWLNLVFEHNSFIAPEGPAVEIAAGSVHPELDFGNNYWGTTETSEIDLMIYDAQSDGSLVTVVTYDPLLPEPHPDTPTAL